MGRYNTIQVDGKQRRAHHVIWERAHGPIPPGYEIHHKDGNGHNNKLENLMMLTRKEHMRLHGRLRGTNEDPMNGSDPDVAASREACKQYYQCHKDQRKAYNHERYREHAAEACESRHEYYQRKHDEIRAKAAIYNRNHREEAKKRNRAYYEANKEKLKAQAKEYRDKHHALIVAKRNLQKAIKKGESSDVLRSLERAVQQEILKLKGSCN